MKPFIILTSLILLCGCGVETATTAATVAKLQADQAKQGKENMDKISTDLDAAAKLAAENARKAEEAATRN